MFSDHHLVLQLVFLGIGSGFLAGLLGIGGGMVMVPFLTMIISGFGASSQVAVKMAIATSMATILFTSIASVYAHHKRGAVRWDVVRGLAPGIAIGSSISSIGLFSLLKGSSLAILFALFVGFSATQMLLDKKPKPTRMMPGTAGRLFVGGGIGLLSGLVGAGGGFVSVPFMTWCNVAMRNAVATSAALGFPIALVNVTGYMYSGQSVNDLPPASFGFLWMPALALIAVCSTCTAPLGARAAHSMPVPVLKRIFAIGLYLLAAYMFFKAAESL